MIHVVASITSIPPINDVLLILIPNSYQGWLNSELKECYFHGVGLTFYNLNFPYIISTGKVSDQLLNQWQIGSMCWQPWDSLGEKRG